MKLSPQILAAASEAWQAMSSLRQRRERYRRYTYGDQWSDLTVDTDGNPCTEGEAASLRGQKPLSNNLIRHMVKSVIGRFRSLRSEQFHPAAPLADIHSRNALAELDARTLEEFLISGMAVQRVVAERRPYGTGVWVDNVSPTHFFVNALRDPRGWEAELVGMLHDWSLGEVVMRFAGSDPQRAAAIRQLYAAFSATPSGSLLGIAPDEKVDFAAAPAGRCRVIEVWTLESREQMRVHDSSDASFAVTAPLSAAELVRLNADRAAAGKAPLQVRWEVATVWHCRFLSPDGTVLSEFDSPFAHGSHPFIVKFYPLVDGEVHSLVEDVIDQQRYVNRLITLLDHMMAASAKGALLFPVTSKMDQMSWQQLTSVWTKTGAVIPYRPVPGGPEPHQITSSAGDIGARDLLTLQIKMFEDVSGVSGALLGHTPSSATGAARYESELRSATTSIADLLDTFSFFLDNRDSKALNTI